MWSRPRHTSSPGRQQAIGVKHDIELAKAAFLYADDVEVLSPPNQAVAT
jgi:hypothetical protein